MNFQKSIINFFWVIEWRTEPSVFQINVFNSLGPEAKTVILKAPNSFLNTGNPKWQMNLLFNATFFQYVYLHSSSSPDQYITVPQLKSSVFLNPGIWKQTENGQGSFQTE